jgi:hypothetical protein
MAGGSVFFCAWEALDVNRSVLGRFEESEARRKITLKTLSCVGKMLGCWVVYGIVCR